MAFLRFEGAQAPIDLSNAALVAHDATQVTQNNLWRYTNGAGDRIEVSGENFTYDNLDLPTSGSVSTVRIDIGADGGPSDVVVSGLNFDPRHLAENARSFWDGVLAGNDVVNVQGLDIPVVGTAAASVVFGDSLQSQRSTNEGTVTDRGGNDVFITGNGIYTLIGDAHTVEGDQREVFVPPQPGTGTQPPIGGGFVTVTEFARYEAGNDTITGQQTGGLQTFVGDAFAVGGRGTLLGGDDNLSSASFNSGSRMIGDAVTVAGSGGTFARVEGGDDRLTGLDPAGGLGSRAVLIGDVDQVGDFARIQGGADIIRGSARDETITGDVFAINGSDETLIEAGDDDIAAGAGNDRVAGDLFASTLFLQDRPAAAGNEPPLLVGGDDLIHGGDGDDVIHGEAATTDPNLLDRMVGGDDRLFGDAGDDKLFGQTGDDILVGGAGADELDGGSGIDTADYSGSAAAVTVNLQVNDIHGGDAEGDVLRDVENLIGSSFGDRLKGAGGANRLEGLAGDDVLDGGQGADQLIGGDGSDTADYSRSGAGVTISLLSGNAQGGDAAGDTLVSIENLIGSDLGDFLKGDAGANRLDGGGGDDRLQGGVGADVLIGGSGTDTADYSGSAAAVTVSLESGAASGGDAAGDSLSGIENLLGSSRGDFLKGDGGANTLDGGAGDDLLEGGVGGDILIGGDGIDTVRYAASSAGVTISLLSGNAVGGEAEGDSFSGLENLIGSNHADFLKGDAGTNRLDGGLGNDRLDGADGADILAGGAGADILNGDGGSDTSDYAASAAGVTISLLSGNATGGDAVGDVLSGIENLSGSSFADFLKGDAGANRLSGGGGNDRLDGHGGDDILVGGNGADALNGDAGSDTADYGSSAAGVTVSLLSGNAVGGDAAGDSFSSIENLMGSAHADILKGDDGANRLAGGAGDDVLIGAGGDDRFVFGNGGGDDRIEDFVAGAGSDDRIDLTANAFLDDLSDVLAHSVQVGSDTIIDLGGGDSLTLAGVGWLTLNADDFAF